MLLKFVFLTHHRLSIGEEESSPIISSDRAGPPNSCLNFLDHCITQSPFLFSYHIIGTPLSLNSPAWISPENNKSLYIYIYVYKS